MFIIFTAFKMGCANPGNMKHFSGPLAILENERVDNCHSTLTIYQEIVPLRKAFYKSKTCHISF